MRSAIVPGIVMILCLSSVISAADISVAAGESIQKAIDAAPDGATITIAAGVFAERLTINKPLTLQGAGWDKTIIKPDKGIEYTQQEKDEFFKKLQGTSNPQERAKIAMEIAGVAERPSISVKSAKDVKLAKLKVQGRNIGSRDGGLSADSLVVFDNSSGSVSECAVVGPFMNGVSIVNGSDVQISKALVAALWGTGVQVDSGAKAKLSDSDIRNCYHRCITTGSDDTIVENCRISGSAWHGIRYDNCSPTIVNNQIFGNARFGIYASGKTAANVRDNVFAKNEMSGMSCWFDNADTVEGNKFLDNARAGMEVLGASRPTLAKNVFVRNPVAVEIGKINGRDEIGSPTLGANTFWQNKANIQREQKEQPLPRGSSEDDPKLGEMAVKSAWEIQAEEKAIIPDSETRDYSRWKKVADVSG